MKSNKFTNLLVLGLVLTVAVAGCRKRPGSMVNIPPGQTENPNVPTTAGNPGTPGTIGTEPVTSGSLPPGSETGGIPQGPGHPGWPEDAKAFEAFTVHFALDSSVVRKPEESKVQSVAAFLKSNMADAVRVEGHCDERGTAEYNRALGERRALALREDLVRFGIDPARVDTTTWGYDRPVDTGHNEAAWSKNRRGEFILLTPPKKPVE